MNSIKTQLHNFCLRFVEDRINTAKKAMEEAQTSAHEETKSSAGDKYETGRAMMQIDIEKNSVQLSEALKLKQTLSRIVADKPTAIAQLGSLVISNHGNFYIAVSAGQLKAGKETYFAISPASPIGALLIGRTAGHSFTFNKKDYTIERIE